MKIVSTLNIDQWNEFVENHPKGNIFQTPEMFEMYKKTKNYHPIFIAVKKNEIILAILLAVIQKEYSGILGEFTSRSIIYGGPLVIDNNKEALDYILKEYNKKVSRKVIFSQFRNQWDWGNLKEVFSDNEIKYEEHLDILFDLTKGEEQLWKEMTPKRRQGINKAIKKKIVIKEIDISNVELLNESYQVIKLVYQRIKLPLHDFDFFRNAKKYHGDRMLALGIYVQNELIAIRFVLCYNNNIYDWYAGAKDDFLSYRPNDVLPWELIKWGVRNNYKIFDFGGAGKPNIPYGVRDFKLKFGGNLVEFGRFEKIHKPIMMSIAKIGLVLYKLVK